jgi:hypothetical protein
MSKTDSSHTNHRSSKDFNRALVARLNARGIYFHGSTWLPSATGDYANGERGYQLDDNGTHRVRTYAEVIAMGGAP